MDELLKHLKQPSGVLKIPVKTHELMFWLRATTVLLTLLLGSAAHSDDSYSITYVLGGPSAIYQQLSHQITRNLKQKFRSIEIHSVDLSNAGKLNRKLLSDNNQHNLVVAIGSNAHAFLEQLGDRSNQLAILVPKRVGSGKNRSYIYLDQPIERFVAAIKQAFPHAKTVGLAAGPESQPLVPELEKKLLQNGLNLYAAYVPSKSQLSLALEKVLKNSDVLLALPDSMIFDARVSQMVMLSTYHHRKPLVGFSKAYVRAGATLAIYSSLEQIVTQSSKKIISILSGKPKLPNSSDPDNFYIAVNYRVAQSLGLRLPKSENLLKAVKSQLAQRLVATRPIE